MTMAPELDPQGELIRFCRSQNVSAQRRAYRRDVCGI